MQQEDDNRADNLILAIACAIAAHFMFGIMGLGAKYLSSEYHAIEIAFYRNVVAIGPMLLIMMLQKRAGQFKTKKPLLLLARCLTGVVGLIVTFEALKHLPMSYAVVLFFTSTIITPIIAFFVLRENVGIHRWSAVIIGMCGVFIISQPSGEISQFGLFMALAAALSHALIYIMLRGLKSESPITVTFYFVLAGIIGPAIFLPWVAEVPTTQDFWIFVVVGLSGAFAQVLLATAYKNGQASLVTPFAYSALIWTVLLDIFFWGYDLDFLSVSIGATLIMAAQLYIIHREYVGKNKRLENE